MPEGVLARLEVEGRRKEPLVPLWSVLGEGMWQSFELHGVREVAGLREQGWQGRGPWLTLQ